MNFQKGDTVKVRYDGQANGSFGVPKNQDGQLAKVLKVGRTRLKVLIGKDPFAREIWMTSCKKVRG